MLLTNYIPYEAKMCFFAKPALFLPYKVTHESDGHHYHLDTGNQINLAVILMRQQEMDASFFRRFIAALEEVKQVCKDHLLHPAHVDYGLEHIYQNAEGKFQFTYLPVGTDQSLSQQLKVCLRQLEPYLPKEDATVVEKMHQIHLALEE